MAMHVVSQDDLISIAQFDLDQNQNISSPQADCNSLLSLCPCITGMMEPRDKVFHAVDDRDDIWKGYEP
jgi:hypothetical protein